MNSPRAESPVGLVFKLLDQIVAIGETAKQMKNLLGDASHRPEEHLQTVRQMLGRGKYPLDDTK